MAFVLTGLQDRVVVITGAGRMRSIGRELANAFAHAGCDVVITGTGRSPDRYPEDERRAGWHDIESVAEEIRAAGRRVLPVVSDVADEAAVRALLDRTVSEFGRVDFLINNAAAARGADRVPLVEMPTDVWDTVIRVNLRGTMLMSKVFVKHLIDQGEGGGVINISSIAGKVFGPNTGAYASSKAAIQALGAVLAREVGQYGIRVNTICPGIIDNNRLDDVPRDSDRWRNMVASIPLRRPSAGGDVPNMALFLCSEQGSWVTGQSINVDGGSVVQH
ncbi:MAG: SDR family oxidoreductase [Chloroflexi bacterium]|nr:SDR family oxidoreductase [Chloroflexota bacterium]